MTAPEIGSAAPDPVLLERFSQALERMWPEEGRLGLAVSGGPDSLALLLLGAAAIPGKFEVATVDHGLRAESAAECAMVAQVCATLDVPCAILKVQVARGNVQSAGRQARYAALAAWAETCGLDALATAHHADDQVETLVMRLNRGSGLRGLAGIRERTVLHDSGTVLIRPLLGFTQQELAKIVSAAALVPAKDPSNADARYTRARLRQALAGANWVEPAGWVQSAAHLAEMERLLELMIGREWIECVEHTDGELRYAALRTGLPGVNAVRIGVIQSAARLLTGRQIDTAAAADMVQSLIRGRTCNAAGMLGRVADLGGERLWLFQPEPPRRALDQGVAHIGSLAVGDDDLVTGFGDGEQLGDKRIR